jgi:hypothetical protein
VWSSSRPAPAPHCPAPTRRPAEAFLQLAQPAREQAQVDWGTSVLGTIGDSCTEADYVTFPEGLFATT